MTKPHSDDLCPACIAYLAHYPVMADDWECYHGANEQAFMLALADAIQGSNPEGEFADPGWRAAQFMDDAELVGDFGPAPYAIRFEHNVGDWSFLGIVNERHLFGFRNEEGAESEYIADIGWALAVAGDEP